MNKYVEVNLNDYSHGELLTHSLFRSAGSTNDFDIMCVIVPSMAGQLSDYFNKNKK